MIYIDFLFHADKIAQASGTVFNRVSDHCISRSDGNGRLLGGVIYSGFTSESIAMHTAAFDRRWVNRDMLWVCFDYPFNQLGVQRVFGQVPEDNAAALAFDTKLGFKEVTRVPGVFKGGVGLIVMCMEKADCRWLDIDAPMRAAALKQECA